MILVLVLLFLAGGAGAQNCTKHLSIDITAGVKSPNGSYVHEGVVYPPQFYYKEAGQVRGCICEVKTCVRLCCPVGQAKLNRTCTDHPWRLHLDVHKEDRLLEEDVDYYAIETSFSCDGIVLDPQMFPGDEFFIQKNGALFIEGDHIGLDSYCLSTFEMTRNVTQAHICETEMDQDSPVIYVYGKKKVKRNCYCYL